MALMTLSVTAEGIALSGGARLDPRFHYLRRMVAPLMDGLVKKARLGSMVSFSNGLNLPRSSYAEGTDEADALYASVAALSSSTLRESNCVPLRTAGDLIAGTRIVYKAAAVQQDEVLITRSGTPGIAWSGAQAAGGAAVVPSGFVIRLKVDRKVDPNYLAAVLSHPGWRLLTAALAAGKRQDNLSQEQLVDVQIPIVGGDAQEAIAGRYEEALRQIEEIYRSEADFARVCDEVLFRSAGLMISPLIRTPVQRSRIAFVDVADTRGLRLDNRWHGLENSAVRSSLSAFPAFRLGSLLMSGPSKGRQPIWTPEEEADEDTPRAIATATIQSGTINWDSAKPTTENSVRLFPVNDGDLLVAMDGDGSLGKSAVYRGDVPATVDSHISRCRVDGGKEAADAISCYLNSTWGKVQTTSLMTGATGQTQLSPTDLRDVEVAAVVIERAAVVANAYREALREYEPIVRRARRVICEASSDLTRQLLAEGVLRASERVSMFEDPAYLLSAFDVLYTRAWR